jgi:hypothetical protein
VLALAREVPMADAHRVDEPLELAVAVALAGVAVFRMVVDEQLDDVPPGLPDLLGVRVDLHAVGRRVTAGGHEVLHPFDLHDAHPARSFDGQFRMVAQTRDVVAARIGGLHDRLAGIDLVLLVVDRNRDLLIAVHVTPQMLATVASRPVMSLRGAQRRSNLNLTHGRLLRCARDDMVVPIILSRWPRTCRC